MVQSASVKVMRSYDYCHFEVCLTEENLNIDGVNELRKYAAILVDEAVRQYRIAKKRETSRESNEWKAEELLRAVERLKQIPESEWTPEQAATMRSYEDREFWDGWEEDCYYYGDNPDRDHHFSMLNKFKQSRVAG